MATAKTEIPFYSWVNATQRMDWEQGEHVTIVGPTGTGKTELITRLLEMCTYWVFLGTKRKDPTQDTLKRMKPRVISSSVELIPDISTRYILKPPRPKNADVTTIKRVQAEVFRDALMRMHNQGGWTIVPDELRYLSEFLGLRDELMLQWLQGRSEDITMIAATQRPKFVPLEAYSQATHLFFFQDMDVANVGRIAEIVSVHRLQIIETVPRLSRHDALYVNTRTGELFITNTRK